MSSQRHFIEPARFFIMVSGIADHSMTSRILFREEFFLARRLVCFRSLFGQSGFHRKNSVLLIAQNSPYAKIFALSLIWDVPAKFLYANSSQELEGRFI